MNKFYTLFLLQYIVLFLPLKAQWGSLDTTFNSSDSGRNKGDGTQGIYDYIWSSAVLPDNKILVVGDFNNYNAYGRSGLIRLFPDGTPDTLFNVNAPGVLGNATCLALQNDGKILIGGSIISYNWVSQNFITRVKADGKLDSSFVPGNGPNSWVNGIAVQPDGKIIIVGNFSYYAGVSRNKIARLNTNGSLDTSFHVGTGFNGQMQSVAIQSDGKIMVAGSCTDYNGITCNGIVRLHTNGTIDSSFNSGLAISGTTFYAMKVLSSGQYMVAGNFTQYQGYSIIDVARIHNDGSLDTTFNPGAGSNGSLYTLAVQSDGKVIVGGSFTSFNTLSHRNILRLEANGAIDTSFDVQAGADKYIGGLTLLPNEEILVAGHFRRIGNKPYHRFCKLKTNGVVDTSFNRGHGSNNTINQTLIQPDGNIIAVGWFNGYNGWHNRGITRILSNGSVDTSFHTGYGAEGYYPYINISSVQLQPDGKIILAGNEFSHFDSNQVYNLARLHPNGNFDTSFYHSAGANGFISSTMLQNDGKLIIGGGFTQFGSANRSRIARLLSNGTLDNTFNPGSGANGDVSYIALQNDGKIIVSGSFTTYNGIAKNRLIRINASGTIDNSFNIGTGLNDFAKKIVIQPDGKIIVGGGFTTYNGVSYNRIVRLLAQGSLDTTFVIGSGFDNFVSDIEMLPNGKILVSGNFQNYNGVSCRGVARLLPNGTLDPTFSVGSGTDGISSLSIQNDGKVIVAGGFTKFNGVGRNRLARLQSCQVNEVQFITGCDSVIVNGVSYVTSGTYTQSFSTLQDCDSTLTLHLTVLNSSDTIITDTACTSYTLNAQTYTTSGIYTQQLASSLGCDSTIELHLTIHNNSTSNATQTACDSYTWNSQTYSQSGTYTQTLTNAVGCDSLLSLDLTVHSSTSFSLSENACTSFTLNGQTYSSSGTYTQQLLNSFGCDSTLTLNLIINSPNAGVTVNGATLSAIASGGSYQWVSCPNFVLIPGATSSSFTPAANGDYALIHTVNGCSDTSTCYTISSLGLATTENFPLQIYPNPSTGLFNLVGLMVNTAQIRVFSLLGELVFEGRSQHQIDLSEQARGVYILEIHMDKSIYRARLVKN